MTSRSQYWPPISFSRFMPPRIPAVESRKSALSGSCFLTDAGTLSRFLLRTLRESISTHRWGKVLQSVYLTLTARTSALSSREASSLTILVRRPGVSHSVTPHSASTPSTIMPAIVSTVHLSILTGHLLLSSVFFISVES